MVDMTSPLTHYWTHDDVAALDGAQLKQLETALRHTENIAIQSRSPKAAKAMGRAGYLLERLVWPEMNRRAVA